MNELTIVNHNGEKTIDSREVAEMIEKEHAHLLRDIRGYLAIIDPNPSLDSAQFFIESEYRDSQNQVRPCFLLTRKGCDMVANKLTGEKGVLFTAAYVNKFHEMEQFALPQNYGDALRELANTWEAKQLAEAKVKEMQPKAEFFDAVADSKTAIPMGNVAKVLAVKGLGRNKMFEILRDKQILDRGNVPYQRFVDQGLFRVVEQKYNKPDGTVCVDIRTLVYQKGVDYIRKLVQA